ncbi:MAG: hypothetical protein KatS3mg129_0424 [Leptospiraceae bacterium]|nr:MAG: hypothetical protein KatS3mg129_0424 [Leptospiraceae bacterium]
MKKPRKKREIYEAALKVFAKNGYKKTTLEDIAKELDLTKSALYIYCLNKKELYLKSVEYGLIKWQKRVVSKVNPDLNLKDQFKQLCLNALISLKDDPDLLKILSQDPDLFPLSSKDEVFPESIEYSRNILKNLLKKGIEKKEFRNFDLEVITNFLYSLYKLIIIKEYIIHDEEKIIEHFDKIIDIFCYGLFNTTNENLYQGDTNENEKTKLFK